MQQTVTPLNTVTLQRLSLSIISNNDRTPPTFHNIDHCDYILKFILSEVFKNAF